MNSIAGYCSDSSSEEINDVGRYFSISEDPEEEHQGSMKRKSEGSDDEFWIKKNKYAPDPSWSDLQESSSAGSSSGIVKVDTGSSVSTAENVVFSVPSSASLEDISKKFAIHHYVKPGLGRMVKCRSPSHPKHSFIACNATINRAQWNIPQFSHLLMVCSMNSNCYIFDALSDNVFLIKKLNTHMKAVKSCTWLASGRQILSGSYDYTARIHDIETGKELSIFDHESAVTAILRHPHSEVLCLTGSMDLIQLWDRRTSTHVKEFVYGRRTGQVADLVLDRDGGTLFSCNQLVERDSADRSIVAWDMRSTAVLSNQMYQERYSCVRMKLHHQENVLLVQTHGNYIAQFSAHRPYKMHTGKRFEGHQLKGYPSGFDVSPDGSKVVSGSADGNLHVYDYRSAKCLNKLCTAADVITDVCFHPVLPSTCAVTSWAGSVFVYN